VRALPAARGTSLFFLLNIATGQADAHSFSTPYSLPIPFWMYAYGCAATLVLTFALLGLFVASREPELSCEPPCRAAYRRIGRISHNGLMLLRAGAAVCLLTTIAAGFVGGTNPTQNIGMTSFWVIFLLGFAYSTVLIGDLYTLINPWKSAIAVLEALGLSLSPKRPPKPRSCWPALLSYVGLVWVELFLSPTPVVLSLMLLTYTGITVIGISLFGKDAWFDDFDLFERFFGLIGRLAPMEYEKAGDGRTRGILLRPPLAGCLRDQPRHFCAVLFILFMLSSTTYDGIHETVWWVGLFWTNLLAILQPLWQGDLGKAQDALMGWYEIYRQAGLVVFPFVYLALYSGALLWMKVATGIGLSVRSLALRFIYSVIPIAVAYNFTHYFTVLLTQLESVRCLLSDPFDRGWNLLDSTDCASPPVLQMGLIWHLQVAVLLAGHVAGIVLAHLQANRIFATRRQVILGQIPMLALMVLYTVFGLWILALPLGPMRQ
jgi:hypothetical protein